MLVIRCSEWIPLLLNVVAGYGACSWALWDDPMHKYQKRCALVQSTWAEFRIEGEALSLCRCSLGLLGLTLHVTCNCALGCFVSSQEGVYWFWDCSLQITEVSSRIYLPTNSRFQYNWKSRGRENVQEVINFYGKDGERTEKNQQNLTGFEKEPSKDFGSKFTYSVCKTLLPRSFASRLFLCS